MIQVNPLSHLKTRLGNGNTRVKTPTLLQMEAVECGAAALGIILSYYSRIVPLAELRQACGVSRDGSKASNILQAAKIYGLQGKGLKVEIDQLARLQLPYIVFWNFNHFLVVEGYSQQRVYLNDPETGPRSVSWQEFDGSYTGIVLTLEPDSIFTKGGQKPSLGAALQERLGGSVGAIAYCIAAGFLLTLTGMVIPVFSQVFVDEILIEGRQQWLRPLLIGMIFTAVIQGVLTVLRLNCLRRLKIKLSIGLSSKFLWHILRLPIGFYAQRFAGEISNRVRLNDQVADVLSGHLATTAVDAVMVIFYALIMVQYDWVLTLLVVSFAMINIMVLQWLARNRIDTNQRLIQEHGKAAGISIAALQSIETLKASGLESDFFTRWAGYYTKAINSQQALGVTNQTFSVLPAFLSVLSAMLLLVIGGFRVMDGHLSIGMLVAFQGLMQSFLMPVNNLVNFGSTLQELEGNLIRLDDVLRNPIDPQIVQPTALTTTENHVNSQVNQENAAKTVLQFAPFRSKLQGYVELQNVTFGYSRLAPPLIANLNFSVKPGQRVALVGG
ncbi:NHLP family bacteriocin export ABC transporter peptidase/permease/ATPase, partial [Oculatella sp. LEGE 06141]